MRIVVYMDASGEYRWRCITNGRIMAESGESYASKANARRALRRLAVLLAVRPELLIEYE